MLCVSPMKSAPRFDRFLRTLALVPIAVAIVLGCGAAAAEEKSAWENLEPGLDLASFAAPRAAETGDSRIVVLRIDPRHFALRLLNASQTPDGQSATARHWARGHGLVAAINASMYQGDYRTSVSLMKTGKHTNNPRLSRDKAVLAFDRLADDVPPVQIIDRTCQNFDALREAYGTLVQSIRMVSCDRKNVWRVQPQRWSTAAVGIDTEGRVLFLHVASPYSTHEVIDALLSLPIGLRNAMYAEGGPEAQLYVESGGREFEFTGVYEGGFIGGAQVAPAWPVPNVLGIVRTAPGP